MKPVTPSLELSPARDQGVLAGLRSPNIRIRKGRSTKTRKPIDVQTFTIEDFKAPLTVRHLPSRPLRTGVRLWGKRNSQQVGGLSLAGRSVAPIQPLVGGWNLDNFMQEAPYSVRRFIVQSSYQAKRTSLSFEVGMTSRLDERVID